MLMLHRYASPFDRVFRPIAPPWTPPAFVPAVDVLEDPDGIVLRADVPGVLPEDIKLSFESGVLRISGERKDTLDEKAQTYHRYERRWGSFERRFSLPSEVDGGAIDASYAAGVLTVRLPKRAEAKARTIEIKKS
jgi:HSP20 family protein